MRKKRLAIIGCGSSGLICLKYASDELPDWEICCFEKSSDITGCWGRPPDGFVSTSTRYTTQFACFQKYDTTVLRSADHDDSSKQYPDFFNDGEYGRYLSDFADTFGLRLHIQLNSNVSDVHQTENGGWQLTVSHKSQNRSEQFSAVVFCTGLVNRIRPLNSTIATLRTIDSEQPVTDQRIVVIGGGESGVDMAHRLSVPEFNNEVFLSLRSGVRVSPRYHPIRAVPSDFLRNRLLLSFHRDIRNLLGERFVRFRIAFRELLERLFPSADPKPTGESSDAMKRRRYWDMKLTRAARDQLFNVYHNKSDDFLDDVGSNRITIVGPAADSNGRCYHGFDGTEAIDVSPDLIVPSIGYQSGLETITGGKARLVDFFVGCLHIEWHNAFAVGFTRPIIGNIPSTSEMQARYVCGMIAGKFTRPGDILEQHAQDRFGLQQRYPHLDTENVYPIEMFPYCDRLAEMMNCRPSMQRIGSVSRWIRMMLSPATTIHYSGGYLSDHNDSKEHIHLPWLFTAIMLTLKPIDWVYRVCRHVA